MKTTVVLATLAAAFAASTALAQPAPSDRSPPADRSAARASAFARMDADRNGSVTFEEFHAFLETRRAERERRMFQRLGGDGRAVTLDQWNATALQRQRDMEQRRGGPARRNAPMRGPHPRDSL